MRSLWHVLRHLAGSWWRVDRIRASSREARMLDLRPPCVALIDGETVEVLSKNVLDAPAGPRIVYDCVRRHGPDRLLVVPGGLQAKPAWRWLGPRPITGPGERRYEIA